MARLAVDGDHLSGGNAICGRGFCVRRVDGTQLHIEAAARGVPVVGAAHELQPVRGWKSLLDHSGHMGRDDVDNRDSRKWNVLRVLLILQA